MVDPQSLNDALVPGLLFLGAAAASVYTANNPEGIKNFTVSQVEKAKEATEEAMEAVEEIVEEQVASEIAPEEEKKKMVVEKTKPVAAVEEKPKAKTTTDLVKEVASKVEDQRATQKLVETRRATTTTEPVNVSGTYKAQADAEAEAGEAETHKTGRKRKLVLKVIKKVVAPWRKWENIK